MDDSAIFPETNLIKQAVDYLRTKGRDSRLCDKLGSGHAHSLVSAALGYKTPQALKAAEDEHDQWIGQRPMNVPMIENAILRMSSPTIEASQARKIADIISDGLTPRCVACNKISANNIPVGDPEFGDSCEWICRSCVDAEHQEDFAACSLCDKPFRIEELDRKGLCPEHRGEFDYDPEELQDMEDFIEYHTKDNG